MDLNSTIQRKVKHILMKGSQVTKYFSHTNDDISKRLYTNNLTPVFFNLLDVIGILFLYEATNPIIKSANIKKPIPNIASCIGDKTTKIESKNVFIICKLFVFIV